MEITQNDIIIKTKGFAKEIFGIEFNLPITFSGRMTRTLGGFYFNSNKPIKIQYSTRLINGNYKEDTIDSVILHELAHWYLFINNKPYNDGCATFENELRRIGASSTNTIKIAEDGIKFTCSCCGHQWVTRMSRAKKIMTNNNLYHSKCCKATIIAGDLVKQEDTFIRTKAKEQWIEDIIQKYSIKNNSSSKQIKIVANKIKSDEKTDSLIFEKLVLLSTKRKITNAQVIPALKLAIDNGNISDIRAIKATYNEVYKSSLKYLGKKYNKKLNELELA